MATADYFGPRITQDGDWCRREVELALQHKCELFALVPEEYAGRLTCVPTMVRDVVFKSSCTGSSDERDSAPAWSDRAVLQPAGYESESFVLVEELLHRHGIVQLRRDDFQSRIDLCARGGEVPRVKFALSCAMLPTPPPSKRGHGAESDTSLERGVRVSTLAKELLAAMGAKGHEGRIVNHHDPRLPDPRPDEHVVMLVDAEYQKLIEDLRARADGGDSNSNAPPNSDTCAAATAASSLLATVRMASRSCRVCIPLVVPAAGGRYPAPDELPDELVEAFTGNGVTFHDAFRSDVYRKLHKFLAFTLRRQPAVADDAAAAAAAEAAVETAVASPVVAVADAPEATMIRGDADPVAAVDAAKEQPAEAAAKTGVAPAARPLSTCTEDRRKVRQHHQMQPHLPFAPPLHDAPTQPCDDRDRLAEGKGVRPGARHEGSDGSSVVSLPKIS